MSYLITGTAAMVELFRKNNINSPGEVEETLCNFIEAFQKVDFAYPRPHDPDWLPEQLCLTVVDNDKDIGDSDRMVAYRNVKVERTKEPPEKSPAS